MHSRSVLDVIQRSYMRTLLSLWIAPFLIYHSYHYSLVEVYLKIHYFSSDQHQVLILYHACNRLPYTIINPQQGNKVCTPSNGRTGCLAPSHLVTQSMILNQWLQTRLYHVIFHFFQYVTRIERLCNFLSLYLRPKQCNIFLYSKNVNYIIYITKMEFHFNNCIFIFFIKISGEPIKMAKPSILGVRYRQLGQHLLDPLCQL